MYDYELYIYNLEYPDETYELKKEIREAQEFLEFEQQRTPVDQNVIVRLMSRIVEKQEQIDKMTRMHR